MYREGKSCITSSSTSSTNCNVFSLGFSNQGLIPQSVHTDGRLPVTPSHGYAATAACECPGRSISGTMVTKRCGGIAHDVAHLGLGIEAAVGFVSGAGQFDVEAHRLAACTGFRELGVLGDLEAPALVLGQVPEQHVELVERHPVDQFLDVGDALEMPP